MPLKIVRATDPLKIERVVLVVYGQPGIGKTTLSYTAEKPLLLDFDKGSTRAGVRGDSVQVADWSEVANLSTDDLEGYETVIVDTAGRMLDSIINDMIKRDRKMGRGDGEPSLQGWGRLRGLFRAWLKRLQQLGVDVVIVSHSEEVRSEDETKERLDIQGGSKKLVYQEATAMAAMKINANQRALQFTPTEHSYGKDPGGFGLVAVPDISPGVNDSFLGDLISGIKERMNERAAGAISTQLHVFSEEESKAQTAPSPTAAGAEGQAVFADAPPAPTAVGAGELPFDEPERAEPTLERKYDHAIFLGAADASVDIDEYAHLTERVMNGSSLDDFEKDQLKRDIVATGLYWNGSTGRLERKSPV